MNENNKVLYWLTALIVFLMPLGIVEISKMQSNVLIPLTVLIAGYKLYKKEFKISFYEKYAICFVIAILISLYFSNYSPLKGYKNLKGDLKWIFLPTLLGQLEIKKSHYKYVVISFLIGTLLIFKKGIEEIFSWFEKSPKEIKNILDIEIYKNSIIGDYRLSKIFNTLTVTALILGVIIFTFYYLIRDREIKKRYKIIFLILEIFSIFLFMATKSVGMYVAIFGTVITMLMINIKKENIKKIMISLILVVGTSLILLRTPYLSRVRDKMKKGDPARMEIYKGTLPMIRDNLLNGVGYDLYEYGVSYFEKTPNYKMLAHNYKHPHNMGLKMLAETGILGFLAYYFWMINIIKNLLRNKKETISKIALFSVFLMMIYENFETVIFWRKANMVIFFIIALAINGFYKQVNKKILKQ